MDDDLVLWIQMEEDKMSKITYNINKDTTGLVAVIQGHYFLLYPFTQFKRDAKYFSYFKGSDMIEVHFGLFGVVFGKATSKRK